MHFFLLFTIFVKGLRLDVGFVEKNDSKKYRSSLTCLTFCFDCEMINAIRCNFTLHTKPIDLDPKHGKRQTKKSKRAEKKQKKDYKYRNSHEFTFRINIFFFNLSLFESRLLCVYTFRIPDKPKKKQVNSICLMNI